MQSSDFSISILWPNLAKAHELVYRCDPLAKCDKAKLVTRMMRDAIDAYEGNAWMAVQSVVVSDDDQMASITVRISGTMSNSITACLKDVEGTLALKGWAPYGSILVPLSEYTVMPSDTDDISSTSATSSSRSSSSSQSGLFHEIDNKPAGDEEILFGSFGSGFFPLPSDLTALLNL